MERDERGLEQSWLPWARRRGYGGDFSDFWGLWPRMFDGTGEPTVDMYETDRDVIVEADVPGYDPDKISVKITPQGITMSGRMESRNEGNREGYLVRERRFGEFTRTVRFPTEVRAEDATAKYKDGVLRITAPKVRDDSGGMKDLPIQRE
ncbi:MAG: Hsp20/alpha crystallin family protein [Bacillota bacterium]